jgi:hypothetical protein
MKFLCVLCALCGLGLPAFAIDREAFTFTNYDLKVRVEPEQQRLAVRGKITLRNNSAMPQKNIALQISSTLDWRSIQLAGKPVQFLSHAYASDIDHTGALTEAIVTLPSEVPPSSSIELAIAYEGTIPLDATRLTRIGIPEDKAKHSDWDQIGKSFAAVRGLGYVTWYPVAAESANLSELNSVDEAVGRWKARNSDAVMTVVFESTQDQPIFFSGTATPAGANDPKAAAFNMAKVGLSVPTFVIADYENLAPNSALTVLYLPGQEEAAKAVAEAAAQLDPSVPVVNGSDNLQILGLPDPDASPFVTGGMLIRPLASSLTNEAVLSIVYAKASNRVWSQRAWIQEGLAHYAQAAFIETDQNRRIAIDYLNAHNAALLEAEKQTATTPGGQAEHSLINASDDLYLQTKAMYVWWMLRDMLGRLPNDALLAYRSAEDKDAAYMQRLIEKSAHVDLQWFFDDWVYRDRGLPDFHIVSVYPRRIVDAGYMVTVTVENLGGAGAEVPVILRFGADEVIKKLRVPAKSQASIRIETSSAPQEAVVNDGSVPESDVSNNTFKVNTPPESAKP